jgi:hypothetical protein
MIDKEKNHGKENSTVPVINHVGGVTEQLGGVDPDIDSDLMRLSGGP